MPLTHRGVGVAGAICALLIHAGCRHTSPDDSIRVHSDPLAPGKQVDSPPSGLRGLFGTRRSAAEPSSTRPAETDAVRQASATTSEEQPGAARISFSDSEADTELTAEERAMLEQAFAQSSPQIRKLAEARMRAAKARRAAAAEPQATSAPAEEKIPSLPDGNGPPTPSATAANKPASADDAPASAPQTAASQTDPAADPPAEPEAFAMPQLTSTAADAPSERASTETADPSAEKASEPAGKDSGEADRPADTEPEAAAEPDAVIAASADASETKSATHASPQPQNPPTATGSGAGTELAAISQTELLGELIRRYQERIDGQQKAPAIGDVLAARTLLLLDDRPDEAVASVRNWSTSEQDFLNHQLLTLWQLLDRKGHPVRERRWDMALPHLREATSHLAAATGSLDVRALQFCREVNGYGQTVSFESGAFTAGQQVILYCEVENFTAERLSDGFETHLKGSYHVIDAAGNRVAEQALAEDRQTSANFRRDYFLAYILYLPDQLGPGNYRLELTLEDLKGKKYGQASLPLEIRAAGE